MLMLSNLTISLFYVLTRSTKVKRTEVYIIELCLLVCVQVHQVLIIYSSHLNSRKNFVKKTLIPIAETEKMIDVQDSTLPNIKITESIEELNNLLPFIQENFKYPIERAVLLLQSLSNDMTNKFSLSPNLDTIVKDLDEEDKTYIRQSWSNSDMLHIRKREKAKEKKSIEKVLNKYFNIDIILILKQISINWNVDIISLNTRTNKSPLAALGKYCIKYYNLNESFDIAEDKISNFFLALEKNYKPNPYHNSMHAADVLASGLYIITNSFLASTLSDIEALIVILSHLGHDVGHPGYTNRFLVNFRDKIAMECKKYLDNDISVLENMHCSKTFLLLSEPDKNLLYNLDNDQFLLVRKWVIELILATDMGKHFELLGLFKSKSYSAKNIENLDCKLDVLKIIIKASDIGHAAKTIEFHVNWSLLITEEFFRQGDIEKENSRPVSMYCDRETTIISKSQIGFLKNIALPLYETLSLFLNSESFDSQCIEQIKNNISSWEFEYSSNSHKTMKEIQLVQSGSYKNDNTPDVVSLNGFKSISSLVHAKNK
jgi:3'5'-cyclic nucleotide phosphodiesterase